MPKHNKEFSHPYKEEIYAIWYTQNRPNMTKLQDIIKPDEFGETPAPGTLTKWRDELQWDVRADTADIEISNHTDREIVKIRMSMMKRHAEIAQDVANMAYDHLKESGFDSSTSAVTALFKAVEEEKRSRGMEVALTQVFSMNDTDLQKTMNRLLSRATGLTEEELPIIDGAVDAISTEETPNE